MIKKIFPIIFLLISSLAYSQKMEFRDVKILEDKKTVYFQIKGLDEDESERNNLLNKFLAYPKIFDGRIFTSSTFKTRCQLFLAMDVEPEYIREILLANGYDFEFSSVSIDGKYLVSDNSSIYSPFYYPSKDFPKPLFTGDKKQDALLYQQQKEEWIKHNKKAYKNRLIKVQLKCQ